MQRILPSYPLFVKDPNFSLWMREDDPTQVNVTSWWGEQKPVYGFVKTEEGTYCFLGAYDDVKDCGVLRAQAQEVKVSSFSTDYTFRAGKATLTVSFVSPLAPDDLSLLSMPVCYMNYEATGVKNAEVSLFVNRRVCYNDTAQTQNKQVRGGVAKQAGYEAAFFGVKRQTYLSNNDDGIGADWGYWYAAGKEAFLTDGMGMAAYLAAGNKSFPHRGEELYIAALGGKKGKIAVAYDDIVAIDYFGSFRKTLYLEDHTVFDALATVWDRGDGIDVQLAAFDADLRARAREIGENYYDILAASLRQSVAAHKTVRSENGEILFLSKENFSNGCIGTVDVSYPSIPLYLLYNTELVKGMMRPICKFARMPVWTYDFAPHDVGTYPACCGQTYGLRCDGGKYHGNYIKDGFAQTHAPLYGLPACADIYDLAMQMPVEECANMLIMTAACYRYDKDLAFFTENRDLFAQWVEYLVRFGLKPENQLCTDDFAGHLKNNLNLSVKAAVGIGAYARLCAAAGDGQTAATYADTAKKYADEISAFARKFAHAPLTWDSGEETFSLKYNMAFDKILGLGLFPQELYESETDCYLALSNEFGTPLDSRETYTKSDWICWAATLTDVKEKREKLLAPLTAYLRNTPTRVPFCDWYDTVSGKQASFQARSVVGGHFILLLS